MSAPAPSAGEAAPDFELRDQHGQRISLVGLRGRPVVLMFYPFAFSQVCTGELAEVRDNLDRLGEAVVLGVSCDPVYALRVFADRDRLEFPLLSDFWPHGAVASAYGVFDDERGCAQRSTFVIDGEGTVRWAVHNALPDARDLDRYVQVLRSLTSGAAAAE